MTTDETKGRRVVWFSCGAASAVAAHITVTEYENVSVVYCDVMSTEHPDNQRFFNDVAEWIGQPIERVASDRYADINAVFEGRKYLAGVKGAPCTVEMKKRPRHAYERPDDIHIFGFTADEHARIATFEERNPELLVEWVLADRSLTKADCMGRIQMAGIKLPVMYSLGYKNNNCLGCVKATSARYWNMTRRDFPDVFELRAEQSRELGVKLTRVRGVRTSLDDLPADYMGADDLETISCGPDCAPPQLTWDIQA